MSVDQNWTDPSTGGGVDLAAGEVLTEAVWDDVLSNIKRLGGTNGGSATAAANGVIPSIGYIMGGTALGRHVTSGTIVVNREAGRTGRGTVTFGVAFSAAPHIVFQPHLPAGDGWWCGTVTTTQAIVQDFSASTEACGYTWIALGAS